VRRISRNFAGNIGAPDRRVLVREHRWRRTRGRDLIPDRTPVASHCRPRCLRPAEPGNSGGSLADQKRVVTPRSARDAGASVLVIGRPISRAADPVAAARAIEATL